MPLSRAEYETFDQDKYLRDIFGGFKKTYFHSMPYVMQNKLSGKSGYGITGHDYTQDVLDDAEFRSRYRRDGSESFDQWVDRLDREFGGFKEYLKFNKTSKGILDNNQVFADDQKLKDFFAYDPSAEAKKEVDKQDAGIKEIEDFAATLMGELKMDDPEVQRMMTLAQNRASNQARLQGVQGPMSVANSEKSMGDALAGYNMDRKQLGMQALSMKHNANVQQFQQQQMQARQRWEDQVGLSELRRSKDPTQYIVGGAGAAIGGVGGFFAGGPAGAAAGASAGWNIGRGLGQGMSGGGYMPPPPNYGRTYGGY